MYDTRITAQAKELLASRFKGLNWCRSMESMNTVYKPHLATKQLNITCILTEKSSEKHKNYTGEAEHVK